VLAVVAVLAGAALATAPAPLQAQAAGGQAVGGRVLNAVDESGVEGAEVRALDLDGEAVARSVTDSQGRFRLPVEAGAAVTLVVHHLAFDSTRATVLVGDDPSQEFFELWTAPRALDLEGLSVRVRPRALALAELGFYDRARQGWAEVVGPEELHDRRSQPLSWFLRRAGAIVRNDRAYFLRSQGLAGGALNTQGSRSCPATLLLDGQPWPGTLRDLPTEWVMGMEVYKGAIGVPAEFRQWAGCGLVLVWSRR
jgi:hypothetical protein